MKENIKKMFSNKNVNRVLIVILLAIIAFAIYVVRGVNKNVALMEEQANETVTYFPEYPAVNTTGKDAALIKRGEYLSKAGDCIACHTNTSAGQNAKAFAGGLPMYTPFGAIYTPNITPDKETGIGNWTQEQFNKAMREGVSPNGHFYFPAFPYLYFSQITDNDLTAIKTYLDSIPAVHQENLKNEMVFPFNWRFMQLGWRLLFFYKQTKSSPYQYDSKESAEWNQGAYLVQGLGHCAMCHSPSYHLLSQNIPLGAPIRKYNLSGAKVQGFLAPNITQANLANVPLEEIVDVFTKDHLIGGGKIEGPMLEANHDSLRYLTHDDLLSIATYLKALVTETPPKPKGAKVGKGIYEIYCSGCHASGAGGAPKFGDAASWNLALKKGIDNVYQSAIQGIGSMPAKGTCLSCSDEDIKQSVDYMIAASKKGGGRGPILLNLPKPLTIADGKRIYEARCSYCHNGSDKAAPKLGDKNAWLPYVNNGFLQTYTDVITGQHGHPIHGACPTACSDAEIKAAVKYMMQESSTGKDYSLW